MMRFRNVIGLIISLSTVTAGVAESPVYFISGAKDEWTSIDFGWRSRGEAERVAAIPARISEFLAGLDSDTKRLAIDVSSGSGKAVVVLNDYVDVRDVWVKSESFDRALMALAITQAIDEVLAIATVRADSRDEYVAPQLSELSRRNILRMSSVFAILDKELERRGVGSRSLSSFCGEIDYYGRTGCWKQYIKQFALFYTNEQYGEEATFSFLDLKLNVELDPLSRHSKLQSVLTNIESVMALDSPACHVYFVASVLDRRAMTTALMELYKAPRKERADGVANSTLERVLGGLGAPGSRWLVVSVTTGDEYSDGLAAIEPRIHPDGLSLDMRQWMLDRSSGRATRNASEFGEFFSGQIGEMRRDKSGRCWE